MKSPIGTDDLVAMAGMPPLERLRTVVLSTDVGQSVFRELEAEYQWFLDLTNLSEAELKSQFQDKTLRTEAFQRADKFGQHVYTITKAIAEKNNYLRFMLV